MKVLLALLCIFVLVSAEGVSFRISSNAFEAPSRANAAASTSMPVESPVSDSSRVWTWRSPFAFVSFSFATSSSSSDSSPSAASSLSSNAPVNQHSPVVSLSQQTQQTHQHQQMTPWGSMLSGVLSRFIQAARAPIEERESTTNFAPVDHSPSRAAAAASPATETTVDAFSTIRSWIASARARAHAALHSDERSMVTARRRTFSSVRQGRLACIRESAQVCPDATGFLDALQCLYREKAQLSQDCTSFLSTKPLFKCAPDVQDLCPDIESKNQAWQCLASQQDALSSECAVAFESHRYRSFMRRVNRNRQRLQDRLSMLLHDRQPVSTPVFVEWQQSGSEPSTDTPLQSLIQTSATISDTLRHSARGPVSETQADKAEPIASASMVDSPQSQSPPWIWIALGIALLLGMLFVVPLARQRLTQVQPAQLEGKVDAVASDSEDEDDNELPEPMSVRFAAAPLLTTVATKVNA